jgi:glucokinase
VWSRALSEDDEMAVELFEMAVDALGVAVGSAVNLLDLELVVFGGGPAEKLGQDLADRIAAAAGPWMMQPNPDLASWCRAWATTPGSPLRRRRAGRW